MLPSNGSASLSTTPFFPPGNRIATFNQLDLYANIEMVGVVVTGDNADIYDNRIHHIGDDGLEPEGACINQRFRDNTVDTNLVGISLAPITHGPTWVLRSLFTNFTGTSIKEAIPTFVNAAAHCPPLPPPTEPIVTVSTESQLREQAYSAGSGTTILVEPGVYYMQDFVHVVHEGITIRGATGQRGDVILDMGGMATGHFGILIEADDVTIADLTIREASDHGVSIQGVDRPTLYNLHILDTGDQLVKVNPLGDGSEDGLLACSRLEYTTTAPDEYTNGISAHDAHRWVVRDNEWFRIRTPGNTPVPTILFWSGSTDTVVERNLLVDCFQGISFGNSSHGSGDHFGGIVRNNMIYASLPHDVVIEMVHAEGWLVAHNTALLRNPVPDLGWGMEARFSDSQGVFAYNLTNLDIWPGRDGAQATLTGNLTDAEAGWFVGAETGDLHLVGTATRAIDQAVPLDEVTDDFDGDARPFGPASDVGADEYGALAPAARVWLPCVLGGGQPNGLEVGEGQSAPLTQCSRTGDGR
jgi:hypothetical protein